MRVYIILWGVALVCSLFECSCDVISFGKFNFSVKKITFLVLFIFLLLLGIFRSESLGVDQENYYRHYYSYGRYSVQYILSRWRVDDVGYFLLGKLFYVCGASFWLFKSAIYTLALALTGIVVYRYSNYPAFSFMILFGTGFVGTSFTLLRLSLAIAICMISFIFIEKKQFIKFLLLVMLAATFHKSALFFLLLYFIIYLGFSSVGLRKKIVIFSISILASFTIVPRLFVYYARNDYSDSVISGRGISSLIFFLIIAVLHTYIYRCQNDNRENENHTRDLIMEVTTWSAVYMQIEAVAFSTMARVVYFFSSLQCISLPGLIKSRRNRWPILIVFLTMYSVMYFRQLFGNGYKIVPYVSIF